MSKSQKVVRNLGNVDAEFAKGGKVIEATYITPMLAHVRRCTRAAENAFLPRLLAHRLFEQFNRFRPI